jgi:GR25 family glycosyltransferase involved in LPS biosynthesis
VSLPFHGYFINVDHKPERRLRMEDQLQRLGLMECYRRVAAHDGNRLAAEPENLSRGEYGCFASHIDALSQGALTGTHLHILEDDALLSPHFPPAASKLVRQGLFNEIDILFTDVGIRPDSVTVRAIDGVVGNLVGSGHASIKLLDLNSLDWTCSASYLVAARSVNRLKEVLAAELRSGPRTPFDIHLRSLVRAGQFRACVCLPFLTSIALDLDFHSSVRGPDASRIACNIIRQSFYIDCDVGALESALQKHCPVSSVDRRRRATLDAIAFTMYGDFRMP